MVTRCGTPAVAHTDAISGVTWAGDGVFWTTDIAGVAKRWVVAA